MVAGPRPRWIAPGLDISPDVAKDALEVGAENLFDDRRGLSATGEFFRNHFHVRRTTEVRNPRIAVFARCADVQLFAPCDVSVEGGLLFGRKCDGLDRAPQLGHITSCICPVSGQVVADPRKSA